MKSSEAKYQTFFENSGDAMLIIQDGKFIDCNEAAVCMLGHKNKEGLLDTHPSELSPEFQSDGKPSYNKAMETLEVALSKGTHRFEWDHKRKNGEVFPVEVSLTAIPQDGATTLHTVWRDITERKKAEEGRKKLEAQLCQSQKMEAVGQLAGGIAHDFNNLLQAILGYSDLALDEIDPDSPSRESIEEVIRAGERAKTLVAQLLAFSRRQVLEMKNVDLNRVIVDLMKMLQRVIGEHINLDAPTKRKLGIVHADRGQIEQILMNLCVNARDAMPNGGTITIETENVHLDEIYCEIHPWAKLGEYVLLSVNDTGRGMDKETLVNIFEPFFTTKNVGEGTGLGLSTVYGLVKQHGGLIRVHSKVGEGTTFEVYLPLVEAEETEFEKRETAPPQGGSETILLADDDEGVRNVVRAILRKSGYTVLMTEDGEAAIRLFDEHAEKIDMALLDVVMPKCGGKAVYDYIRTSSFQTPILFASGYNAGSIHTNFILDSGMQLIQKPYQRDDLLRKIRDVLDS